MRTEPTTKKGKETRERIVDAAASLIGERGVEGASLDRILAMAGASKSQLYHYFSDKDDLVRAVIASQLVDTLAGQMPLLGKLDSWAAIRRWFDLLVSKNEAYGFHGCPIGTLADELSDRDELARVDLADCFHIWQRYLVEGLQRMRSRGDLVRNADPQRLATAVFASIQGGLLLSKTQKDTEPLRVALDAAFSYLRSFMATSRTRKGPGQSSPS